MVERMGEKPTNPTSIIAAQGIKLLGGGPPPLIFRCGFCRKFRTSDCPGESLDNIREKIFNQEEDSEPISPICFEIEEKKIPDSDALIQLFADSILESFTVRHFVKDGSPLGLYMWKNGRYVEAEEELRAIVEGWAVAIGIEKKVKTRIVNEVIEKVKRRTYFELPEEPLMIAFRSCAFAWEPFLNGDISRAIIPIEQTKERPIFHFIPWSLDIEILTRGLERLKNGEGFEALAQEWAPQAVEVFRGWVGDSWLLLFEIIGYCLYPRYPLNKAFMLVGDGSNGKSTYLRLLKEILGAHNIVGLSLQDLCNYRFAASELYHKLANIYEDIPAKPIGYTGPFKILTGEDWFSAPRKFKTSIFMCNYAKLIFSANELPQVSDQTYAFWRRWIVIEFPNKFPDDPGFFERTFTPELIERIIALGILALWGVWRRRAFSVKERAEDFKEKWLRATNPVYAYVKGGLEEGRLTLDREAYTDAGDLYMDYESWAKNNDTEIVSKATFTKELERLFGIVKKRIREGGRLTYVYYGVKLLEKGEDEGVDEGLDSNAGGW
jgi:putative DNA primase/helicase